MPEDRRREALRRFIERSGTNANALAKRAGVRSSTIYNYLSGTSQGLSLDVVAKLAEAGGGTIDELLGNTTGRPGPIPVQYEVGVHGRMFGVDRMMQIERPDWLPPGEDVIAALAPGEALRPMPGDWTVLFRREPQPPDELLGRLCVVRAQNHGEPLLREIRRGSQRGLFDLFWWSAPPISDVVVQAAHLVLSLSQDLPSISSDG